MKKLLIFILLLFFSISYADNIKIITKEIKDSSVQYRYHTSGKYPQIEGMKNAEFQSKINNEIYETMMKGIDEFKKNMSEWDLSNIPKDFNSEMEYNFTSYSLTDELFSFAFEIYYFYAGAAHPNHWTKSMNFDLNKGKMIAFKDLFIPNVKYVEKISSYCIEDLKLQAKFNDFEFDNDMLLGGAGPKDSNFLNFNILQKGLQITFDPYTVAPYVVGTQYVIISYRTLYEMLDPDGILNKFDF
jgi:hypothetical protein